MQKKFIRVKVFKNGPSKICGKQSLTHFSPASHFYTPRKRQKTFGKRFQGI